MRKIAVLGLVLLVVSLTIVACGGAPAATQPGAAPAAGQAAAKTGGEKTVTIGFTTSQTGSANLESGRQTNGFKLWLDEINAKGGLKLADGTTLKFASKSYDDESKKDRVQELYTKLINDDKADFLISPYSSGLADAVAVVAEQNGKIMITAGAASDSTHEQGYNLVYQTYTPASRYLTGAIDLLASLDPNAKKLAIVHEKDKFSTDVVNAATKYAQDKGYTVMLKEGYDTGTADFSAFINKVPADADAIIGGGHFVDGSTFAKQLAEKNAKAKFIALLVAPPEPKFAEIGAAAQGIVGPSQWEPSVKYSADAAKAANLEWYGPAVADFVNAYKAKYNEDPSYHAAGGYMAGLILQRALEKAGSTDKDKVKTALDATNMMTLFGPIKFDTDKKHGLQTGHDMVYIQWQKGADGKLAKQVVWPTASKTANGVFPLR